MCSAIIRNVMGVSTRSIGWLGSECVTHDLCGTLIFAIPRPRPLFCKLIDDDLSCGTEMLVAEATVPEAD